jgi:uncharacterized membrane protein YciS (DUF1049 family)
MAGVFGMFVLTIADWRMSSFYGTFFAGLALSIATAMLFLRLHARLGKAKPGFESSYSAAETD